MKVIIFGATGYLGLPIGKSFLKASRRLPYSLLTLAHALVRNGHVVVGVSRTAAKNNLLLANESAYSYLDKALC